jgi:hypothetical protein
MVSGYSWKHATVGTQKVRIFHGICFSPKKRIFYVMHNSIDYSDKKRIQWLSPELVLGKLENILSDAFENCLALIGTFAVEIKFAFQ